MIANTYVVKPFGISEVKVIALKGEPGGPTQEQVNAAVEEYMDDHPEAQIPDGSVSISKLSSDVAENVSDVPNKANSSGSAPDLIAGTADNLLSSSYKTDRTPYILRRTPFGIREKGSIVGGSVVWNQLIDVTTMATKTSQGITYTNNGDGSITLTGTPTSNNGFENINYVAGVNPYALGHVYIIDNGYTGDLLIGVRIYGVSGQGLDAYRGPQMVKADQLTANGYVRFQITNLQGTDIGTVKLTPQLFDLTLMFGATIADYIYTQEQASTGAGVALAKAWAGITTDYYPYDPGTIKSVEGLTAHKMVGKNLLQLPNLSATYFGVTISASGEPRIVFDGTVSDSKAHAIALIEHYPMLPGDYILNGAQNGDTIGIQVYNATKGKTYRDVGNGASFTVDEGDDIAIRVFMTAGTSVSNMVRYPMIRFVDVQDATFEPYTAHTYPLDSSLTLRGLPKLDGDSIYYDGDIYKADGTVERRYGVRAYQSGDESDANVLTDGTNTVYKLTTPTTEQAEPYTALQICGPAGTEEFVGASMPVGHDTKYYADLKGKIEDIPDAPTANGTYVLKATVSSSGVTYSWVAW